MINRYLVDHSAIHPDWPPGKKYMVTEESYDKLLEDYNNLSVELQTLKTENERLNEAVKSFAMILDGAYS